MDKIQRYINQNQWVSWLLFIGVFWLFIVNLHLNRGLDDMITGYHYWRKTDTYAQIMNYYYNGLNFFDHGLFYNQMDSGGKAVGEFPLFYYVVAIQLKVFGPHAIIVKANWFVMLFLGMFSLFRIGMHYTKNMVMSLVVPFTLFLSPVFLAYCIDYLPDPIAMSFLFIGLFFLMNHFEKQQKNALTFALIFISLAGLTKPFFLIPYIAFVLVFFTTRLLKKEKISRYWILLLPFVLVLIWFYYVGWYNSKVNCENCFLTSIRPYWEIKPEILEKTNAKILNKWWPDYFHPIYLWVLLSALVLSIVVWFKSNKVINAFSILSVLGSAAFIVLLYGMLKDHDYYIFPVLFLAPLTALLIFYNLSQIKWPVAANYLVAAVVLVLLYADMQYAWAIRQQRLKSPGVNASGQFVNYQNLDHFLLKHDVQTNDFVVAFSDKCPNYALTLLNRKGWSGFQTFYKRIHLNELIDKGAKFLIINNALPPKRDSVALENINMEYLGDTNQIYLYKLSK